MSLRVIGGAAAVICAATYLIGFALLLTLLAPLGYGSEEIDVEAVVAFIGTDGGLLIAWNTVIYIVNGLALVVLTLALHARLKPVSRGWAATLHGFGLIWGTLVLGAGMIANVTVERVAGLVPDAPARAADLWEVLHAVELGLGGGNEVVGAVWIFCAGLAGLMTGGFGKPVSVLGLIIGVAGGLTVVPPLGDAAGAVFGLGAILWFLGIGGTLLSSRSAMA